MAAAAIAIAVTGGDGEAANERCRRRGWAERKEEGGMVGAIVGVMTVGTRMNGAGGVVTVM